MESASAEWSNNIEADPQFVDPSATVPNLNLKISSPCNDAATHLTLTNGTGTNSTTLKVDDANYFFSGPNPPWNLENTKADIIYVEDMGEATIASIDYSTNTITLTFPANWGDNKKVYHRKFFGSAPEIGAYEHNDSGSPPLPPNNLRVME